MANFWAKTGYFFRIAGAFISAPIGQLIYKVATVAQSADILGTFLQNSAAFSGHTVRHKKAVATDVVITSKERVLCH